MGSIGKLSTSGEWPGPERRKRGWSLDWQTSVERDKTRLARVLHDQTGGLLVAAVMDITWVEPLLRELPEVRARLARARVTLDEAIELNRRIIEDLRPTLLDNFGLVAALKWHFTEVCKAAQIDCEQSLMDVDIRFSVSAAIALYRVAETLLSLLIRHSPRSIKLSLAVLNDQVLLGVTSKHSQISVLLDEHDTASAFASVEARILALGGETQVTRATDTFSVMCRVPVSVAQFGSTP
jgi:signal transduction histidine kinase